MSENESPQPLLPFIDQLKKVLRGDLSSLPSLQICKSKLSVFISSAFTDSHKERNILMDKILPALQEKALQYGLLVTFSDMRYDIRDENTIDHISWIDYAKEIRRCYEESGGVFFISLQGRKYGFMPIPKYINHDQVDERKKILAASDDLLDIYNSWYDLNMNIFPPRYELKKLLSLDETEFYTLALPQLRQSLKDVPFDIPNGDDLFIYRSITEWETKLALKLDPSRCFWFHHNFSNEITLQDDPKKLLFDAHDAATKLKLENLLSVMKSSLPSDNIILFNPLKFESYLFKDEKYFNYLYEYENLTLNKLNISLDNLIQKKKAWSLNGFGAGTAGIHLDEILHHLQLAHAKTTLFEDRHDVLQHALELIKLPNRAQNENTVGLYESISMCIVGTSGAGRSSMMAKLAQQMSVTQSHPVLIRFCGTSMDSIDQLSNVHEERSQLSLFKSLLLHKDSRIIVSCLPDELMTGNDCTSSNSNNSNDEKTLTTTTSTTNPMSTSTSTIKKWKHCYQCDTRLIEANIPRITIGNIGVHTTSTTTTSNSTSKTIDTDTNSNENTTTNDEIRVILQKILRRRNIMLQPELLEYVSSTICDVINVIAGSLEKRFGFFLTRYALGFISFSKGGVNDLEMQDLLTLNEDVLIEVFQYAKPEGTYRLPFHRWIRLKNTISILLQEQMSNNNCIQWKHKLIQESIVLRYKSDEKSEIHQILGCYFANMIPAAIKQEHSIRSQTLTLNESIPIWYERSLVNRRRCIEASYNLLEGGLFEEAARELCSFEMICAFLLIASDQPQQSIIKQHTNILLNSSKNIEISNLFLKYTKNSNVHISHNWKGNIWKRGVSLGGTAIFSPLLTELKGHTASVTAVSVSNDGNSIVSGSEDKKIKIWNAITSEVQCIT
eukprot:gene11795-24716_t